MSGCSDRKRKPAPTTHDSSGEESEEESGEEPNSEGGSKEDSDFEDVSDELYSTRFGRVAAVAVASYQYIDHINSFLYAGDPSRL